MFAPDYTPDQEQQLLALSQRLLAATPATQYSAAAEQVSQLLQVLPYHEWRYYVQHAPVLADAQYDQLMALLQTLERQFPDLQHPLSPTLRVGSDLSTSDTGNTVAHLSQMLSLENAYTTADLLDFEDRVRKLAALPPHQPIAYVVEPKLDGGTIVLLYQHDVLVRAATRGDGYYGDDITHNARAMADTVPQRADFSKYGWAQVEIRGEAIINKHTFEQLNAARAATGETPLANPRNAATGALRVKDSREVSRRRIEVFAYHIAAALDAAGQPTTPLPTHTEQLTLLAQLGFKVPTDATRRCADIHEAANYCAAWETQRDTYPYEIDGMVVKLDRLDWQQLCGSTSHHPRWAIAYKFRARQATTRLLDVQFQVGRTGAVTPVARLAPIALAGVTVSNASLHNHDLIAQKDIRLGDWVLVERAGDVIPYVVGPIPEARTGQEQPITFPTHCPVCEAPLHKPDDEVVWRCDNPDCEAQVLERLIHFGSKDAMDIRGLGAANIERFYALGWLRHLTDLYRLDYNQIATLEGFGQRSADNLRQAIEASRHNPLWRLLYGLGIRFVGESTARKLAAAVPHLRELCSWSPEQLMTLDDIGPKVARTIYDFFQQPHLPALLDEFEALGVNLYRTEAETPRPPDESQPLSGKNILFTGTLTHLTRDEAEERARQAGAKVVSGVSSKLHYLVAGEKAGSKLDKAQQLGTVQILTEQQFMALLAISNAPS